MDPVIRKAILTRRSRLISLATEASRNGQIEKKADIEMRLRYLQNVFTRFEAQSAALARPRIFISYSKAKGQKYYDHAARNADRFGFDVHDGFKRTSDANVLGAVRNAIAEAAVFLVIMTPELKIQGSRSRSKRQVYAPSVWVVEEKGMALGLGKPFRMLVHESVHEDYWLRTTPGHLHHVFDESTFEQRLEDAMQALQIRYEELALAMVGVVGNNHELQAQP